MQNLKENIEKLNNYLSDTSYNDIDIVDLIKYLSSKFGVKQEIQKEKYQRLEEYIGDSKKVLLVLVDGLGYYKVNELSDSSILKKNLMTGIRTVNPTSTACVLTSVCSAKYPSEHGIFGWWQYLRGKNLNYCPLPMVERKTGKKVEDKGINIKEVFEFESIFEKLNTTVNISMPRELISSSYSKMFSGSKANTHGFYSIREGFMNMSKKLKNSDTSFSYLYIDGLDAASHMYGVNSQEVKNIISEVEEGIKFIKNDNDDVKVIVIADHGQVDMVSMMYLNQNTDYTKYFYALPSIDTRMISFFVKDEAKEEFEEKFLSEFNKDVILLKKSEIEKYKIFGNTKLSKKAKENLGEYIGIVVNDKFMVCDKINIEDCLNTKGNHSGLTKKETTIPLIVI